MIYLAIIIAVLAISLLLVVRFDNFTFAVCTIAFITLSCCTSLFLAEDDKLAKAGPSELFCVKSISDRGVHLDNGDVIRVIVPVFPGDSLLITKWRGYHTGWVTRKTIDRIDRKEIHWIFPKECEK